MFLRKKYFTGINFENIRILYEYYTNLIVNIIRILYVEHIVSMYFICTYIIHYLLHKKISIFVRYFLRHIYKNLTMLYISSK